MAMVVVVLYQNGIGGVGRGNHVRHGEKPEVQVVLLLCLQYFVQNGCVRILQNLQQLLHEFA